MIIEHDELAGLVPHKGRMFLIDRITDFNAKDWRIESETRIKPDFMFYEAELDGVPNYVCFEITAQTIAALSGLYSREKECGPNRGFILSVSNLNFDFDTIKNGQLVRVKAERETAMDNVYSFKAEYFLDGKKAGEGKLTVMEVLK